ncbi:alpha-N-acetylglucosaminidase C-terminal domain-containing protein [Streptomyces sp. NA04227]|uniref:alpha-N-acetylglucosaminidase n=1 Tax=Streptomyces sp. NA04227 TaxID=2742136 RepID=UPI001590AB62|nr:alpha-N-acetylglucosaminidase TIM-barrel domain-containing protein [Streptomyces sp. NA04227]QKW07518.1 alpha-N-acetylglucosaminidase C-terminal domain-containing protein [Streptomyces sp. NA04227]
MKRRDLIKAGSAATAVGVFGIPQAHAVDAPPRELSADGAFDTAPASAAVARLAGSRVADQINFRAVSARSAPGADSADPGREHFRIKGCSGGIVIEGTSVAVLLTGFNWYLKYVAHCSIGWDGDQLALPARLPRPRAPLTRSANVANRLFGNDIWTDYTGPHWTWREWERELDVLAAHGFNQVFMPIGMEDVAHRTLQEFGYGRAEVLRWTPPPAHLAAGMWQGGWTLEDGGISEASQRRYVALGRRILARMRELGMRPLIPGFVGFVPDDFAERNPGANVLDRGSWYSQKMCSWLDPRTDLYQRVAARFYAIQEDLFGTADMYAMNPFTEGGKVTIPLDEAAAGIEKALQAARPGAVWEMHAWQDNPRGELLGKLDPDTSLIVDFQSDRFPDSSREELWGRTPYSFGGVWNFGGHTTMGGNLGVWNTRYFEWLGKEGSGVRGTALSPEAGHGDALPLEFFGELAWRDGPVDLPSWFSDYARRRVGAPNISAERAWRTMGATAYALPATGFDEAHDSLFHARPSLTVTTAAAWSPTKIVYDAARFATALDDLLAVPGPLRSSTAYRYDLVSVARQVLDNGSRTLLPRIKAAYDAKDLPEFRKLTSRWLDLILLTDELVGTVPAYLLGPWIESARAAGADADEQRAFVADAKQVLTTWGNKALSEADLHDYCNRGWQGLLGDFYHGRWKRYFATLDRALTTGTQPEKIDWYAHESDWIASDRRYAVTPVGDPYALAARARAASRDF